MNFNKYM